MAETLAQDPSALHPLLEGEQAPVKIDWHDEAVIVTVVVVRPKAQEIEYVQHTGKLLADLRLALSRAETQYIEHAYLSDPGEQWAQMERGPLTRKACIRRGGVECATLKKRGFGGPDTSSCPQR